jgi:hypothetical protein
MADNIQAVLFDKNYWNTNAARAYLKANGKQPIKRVHTTDNYHRYRLIEPDYNKYHYLFRKGQNHIDYIVEIPMPKEDKQKPKPTDHLLYNEIKKEMTNKYKPSAYRSGLIVKQYKKAYKDIYKTDDAYIGDKPKLSNLNRWFLEDWRNSRGEIGYKHKNDIYRPTIRITADTPKTFNELSIADIERAKKEKALKGRVKKF